MNDRKYSVDEVKEIKANLQAEIKAAHRRLEELQEKLGMSREDVFGPLEAYKEQELAKFKTLKEFRTSFPLPFP